MNLSFAHLSFKSTCLPHSPVKDNSVLVFDYSFDMIIQVSDSKKVYVFGPRFPACNPNVILNYWVASRGGQFVMTLAHLSVWYIRTLTLIKWSLLEGRLINSKVANYYSTLWTLQSITVLFQSQFATHRSEPGVLLCQTIGKNRYINWLTRSPHTYQIFVLQLHIVCFQLWNTRRECLPLSLLCDGLAQTFVQSYRISRSIVCFVEDLSTCQPVGHSTATSRRLCEAILRHRSKLVFSRPHMIVHQRFPTQKQAFLVEHPITNGGDRLN